jgi:hypothetical protein
VRSCQPNEFRCAERQLASSTADIDDPDAGTNPGRAEELPRHGLDEAGLGRQPLEFGVGSAQRLLLTGTRVAATELPCR